MKRVASSLAFEHQQTTIRIEWSRNKWKSWKNNNNVLFYSFFVPFFIFLVLDGLWVSATVPIISIQYIFFAAFVFVLQACSSTVSFPAKIHKIEYNFYCCCLKRWGRKKKHTERKIACGSEVLSYMHNIRTKVKIQIYTGSFRTTSQYLYWRPEKQKSA